MCFILLFDQVSTKQTELGIGQTSYVSYRFKVVDYLPWMYVYEFIMQSKRPDPIQGLNSIHLRVLTKMFTKILTKIVTKKLSKSHTKKFMR